MEQYDLIWPDDTLRLRWNNFETLLLIVQKLIYLEYAFVVYPKEFGIAMSKDAARAIGAYI